MSLLSYMIIHWFHFMYFQCTLVVYICSVKEHMEKLSCLSIPNLPTCTTFTLCRTRIEKLSKNKIIQIFYSTYQVTLNHKLSPFFSRYFFIYVLKLFLFSLFPCPQTRNFVLIKLRNYVFTHETCSQAVH